MPGERLERLEPLMQRGQHQAGLVHRQQRHAVRSGVGEPVVRLRAAHRVGELPPPGTITKGAARRAYDLQDLRQTPALGEAAAELDDRRLGRSRR